MNAQTDLPVSDTIRYDSSKCTGCKVCELVCSFFHEGVFHPRLSRIYIFNDLFSGANKADICQHCVSPDCYHVCSFDAIRIDELNGARILDETRCTSCGECAIACPFNETEKVIKHNSSKRVFYKCDLCDGTPKCVEWCAPNALTHRKRLGNSK